MKVYFVTRFSIFDPQFKGLRLSRSFSAEEYERHLFDEERLWHKFNMFQHITLPSIIRQDRKDWEWLIYMSGRMPTEYISRLTRLISEYSNIHLIEVDNFRDFFRKHASYKYEQSFATVRLDDDDGLSECLVERLQKYSGNVGKVVSFTEGKRVKVAGERVVEGAAVSIQKIALGMAGIGLPIYNCGRHREIDTRYGVIYDATPNMFLLGCSPFTDSQRRFD